MERLYNSIHYRALKYCLNDNTGYYVKEPQLSNWSKLPSDLKIEETQKSFLKAQGAYHVIRGRIKNGQYLFFTGLIPCPNFNNTYFGNDYDTVKNEKKRSLIVFRLSPDFKELTVYYFNHFYKENRDERIKFVCEFCEFLYRQEGAF